MIVLFKMAEPGVVWPLVVVTFFWIVVGGVVPWVVPKGENRGIIQVMLIITAASCYMFWLCTFLMQLNPLIGPQLDNKTATIVKEVWMGGAANESGDLYSAVN